MIIVAGSGRSGTSAVTRMLHEAGLSAGHDLIEADESNAEGYFEERAVVRMNDAILRESGLLQWFGSAARETIRAAAAAHLEEMRALAADATPVWKDPRFSWTLEPWLDVFAEPPRIIVCLRSPAEVVASTLRYYGLEGDEPTRAVEHTWRSEYERLLEVIRDYRLEATSVEFAALHADTAAVATALGDFVGATLDPAKVRADLRHHALPVPDHLQALYDEVLRLAK